MPVRPKGRRPARPQRLTPPSGQSQRILTASPRPTPTGDRPALLSPLELLVADDLAAPAQDERINEVTRVLFTKYRSPADYAAAPAGRPRAGHQSGQLSSTRREIASRDVPRAPRGLRWRGPPDMESLTRLHGVVADGHRSSSELPLASPRWPSDRHVARVAESAPPTPPRRSGHRGEPAGIYPKRTGFKVAVGASFYTVAAPAGRLSLCPICPIIDLCPYPKKTKTLPAALRSNQRALPAPQQRVARDDGEALRIPSPRAQGRRRQPVGLDEHVTDPDRSAPWNRPAYLASFPAKTRPSAYHKGCRDTKDAALGPVARRSTDATRAPRERPQSRRSAEWRKSAPLRHPLERTRTKRNRSARPTRIGGFRAKVPDSKTKKRRPLSSSRQP